MRDISTITLEEAKGLWNEIMPIGNKPFQGAAYKLLADTENGIPDRVILTSGVERLGIYFTGQIWADSDLHKIELDQEKVRNYLKGIGITNNNRRLKDWLPR